MTREEAQEAVTKHGSRTKAAVALGVSRRQINNALEGTGTGKPGRPPGPRSLSPVVHTASTGPRSLSDFRNTYDLNTIVPKKIAAGFKQIGAGWLYESEFARSAGLTLKDLGMFRDNYSDHIVVVSDSRRVWVGKTQVAEEMRGMI